MNVLAIIISLSFFAVSVLHFYWAFGGKAGMEKVIPSINNKPAFQPGFVATLIVAFFLLAISVSTIALRWPIILFEPWVKDFAYFLAVVFMARAVGDFRLVGFFKKEKQSTFGRFDTKYFSPLCLAWSISFIILANYKA
ncbi:MAG: DUF3995 domain-containing protein [Pseudomonadota bacterium]